MSIASVAVSDSVVAAVAEHLASARSRLAGSDFAGAFDVLLAAWRLYRADELAELCEMLSARAARNNVPVTPEERKQTEWVVRWMNAFRECTPLGLGVLIADVDAAFSQGVQPRFIFPRVEALAGVRDDPRIASAMVRAGSRIGPGGAWRKFLHQCVRGLRSAADPRFVARLDRAIKDNAEAPGFIGGSPLAAGAKALKTLRARMKDGPPPLPEELIEAVTSVHTSIEAIPSELVITIAARTKAEGADPVALLAEVRQAPDDYELRLVLADALMSAGDPLGEFIVLQCRRANNESMEDHSRTLSRERGLLKDHLRAWLGPLVSVVNLSSVVFERGFLDRCEAVATKRVTAEVHFQHVEWATARSIRFRGESRITPAMRALREAFGVDITALGQLVADGHSRLERLSLNTSALYAPEVSPLPNETVRAFATCEKLPNLKHLELDVPSIDKPKTDWIWRAPWSSQLRSIGVPEDTIAPWVDELRRRDHLEEVCFLGEDHRVILRKRSAGALAVAVRLETPFLQSVVERALHETLRSLAKLDRFCDVQNETPPSIKISDAQKLRIEQALSRFKRA